MQSFGLILSIKVFVQRASARLHLRDVQKLRRLTRARAQTSAPPTIELDLPITASLERALWSGSGRMHRLHPIHWTNGRAAKQQQLTGRVFALRRNDELVVRSC